MWQFDGTYSEFVRIHTAMRLTKIDESWDDLTLEQIKKNNNDVD